MLSLFHAGNTAEGFCCLFRCLASANLDGRLYAAHILEVLRRAELLLRTPDLGSFFPAAAFPVVTPVQANAREHWILERFVRGFLHRRRLRR